MKNDFETLGNENDPQIFVHKGHVDFNKFKQAYIDYGWNDDFEGKNPEDLKLGYALFDEGGMKDFSPLKPNDNYVAVTVCEWD